MTIRIAFESEMRRAAVQLLQDFAQDFDIKLQTYRARPRSINPPTAFVDRMRETIVFDGLRQRTPTVDIVFVWGLFDSGEAVDQRDATIDAFIDWVTDRFHAAGATTALEPRTVEDDPNYVPDWLPPEQQRTYYSTTLTLEGFAGGY